jgi:hypothetical protein
LRLEPYPSGRLRRGFAFVVSALWCWHGHLLLGSSGLGLCWICAWIHWHRYDWSAARPFVVGEVLVHYYQTPLAVGCKFRGQAWQWVFVDEVSPVEFAALRRMAKRLLVRQPVGLSISR